MKDYYAILGVHEGADADAVKKAYRELARKYHPDLNPGDPAAEERFKDLSEAYAVLSDPKRRQEYDQMRRLGVASPGGAGGVSFDFGDLFGGGGPEALFEQLFGGLGGRRSVRRRRGDDLQTRIGLAFRDAMLGGMRTLRLPAAEPCSTCSGSGRDGDGNCRSCGGQGWRTVQRDIAVRIPAGMDSGRTLRLAGKGAPGRDGGPAGDLHVLVEVAADPELTRDGDHIRLRLPVRPSEAAAGALIDVPTLEGRSELRIPAGAQSGQKLRMRGKGVPRSEGGRGDQLVELLIKLPPLDEERVAELRRWEEGFDPRA